MLKRRKGIGLLHDTYLMYCIQTDKEADIVQYLLWRLTEPVVCLFIYP